MEFPINRIFKISHILYISLIRQPAIAFKDNFAKRGRRRRSHRIPGLGEEILEIFWPSPLPGASFFLSFWANDCPVFSGEPPVRELAELEEEEEEMVLSWYPAGGSTQLTLKKGSRVRPHEQGVDEETTREGDRLGPPWESEIPTQGDGEEKRDAAGRAVLLRRVRLQGDPTSASP